MARKISEEQRKESSIKKVKRVFDQAVLARHHVNPGKKNGLSDTSISGYEAKVITLVNSYFEKHGVGDITKFEIEKVHDLLKEDYGDNAYSIKGYVHALYYFQTATKETQIFREVTLVDKKEMESYYKENDIVRRADDSTVLKAKREQNERVMQYLREESRSPFAKQAALVLELGQMIGTRVEGALDVRGEDITFNRDGTATVYLNEKGNLDRWVKIFEPEKVARLQELKDGLKNEKWTVVEPLRYKNGEKTGSKMGYSTAQERLDKIVQSAVEVLEKQGFQINTEDAGYCIHSTRKTFCQERVDFYASQPEEALRLELDDRIEENKKRQHELMEEKNYKITDVESKYGAQVDRINWVDKENGIRRTEEEREMNKKELCFFLTSLDSGHFRNDVLRFYAKYYSIGGD